MGHGLSHAIQVKYDRPNLIYYPGERVTGNISFENTKDNLKLKNSYLQFIGDIKYSREETRWVTDSEGVSRQESYTQVYTSPIFHFQISLLQPESEQQKIAVRRGQYSWPFEFVLRTCLPASVTKVSYHSVTYYARVVLVRPWYRSDIEFIFPVNICPHVNLLHISDADKSASFSCRNRKNVHLHGSLFPTAFAPGQKLFIEIDLQNPQECRIKGIEASLIQNRKIMENYQTAIIFCRTLTDLRGFNGTELQRTFDLLMPADYLAPTHAYKYGMQNVDISYKLKISVIVRGIKTDFHTEIPIIVGTEHVPDQQQQQTNSSNEMPIDIT